MCWRGLEPHGAQSVGHMFAVDQVVGIEIIYAMETASINFLEFNFNGILNPFEMDDDCILNEVDTYHTLLMRGFCVDLLKNGSISLSDNMAWRSQDVQENDPTFMQNLFRDDLLIRNDGVIEWRSGSFTGKIAKKAFARRHVSGETEFPLRYANQSYIYKRSTGPNIPLIKLDSYIAILVKGLSAVGCFTWMSCHGGQAYKDKNSEAYLYSPAFIYIAGDINFRWAIEIISQYQLIFGRESLPSFATNNSYIEFEIFSTKHARQVWFNLMRLGVWIYLNRIELRRARANNIKQNPS
jgi:hypothetical protein